MYLMAFPSSEISCSPVRDGASSRCRCMWSRGRSSRGPRQPADVVTPSASERDPHRCGSTRRHVEQVVPVSRPQHTFHV
jgi:hypothetical protein